MSESYGKRVLTEVFSYGPTRQRQVIPPPAIQGHSLIRRILAETFGFRLSPPNSISGSSVEKVNELFGRSSENTRILLDHPPFGMSESEVIALRRRAQFGPVPDAIFNRLHSMETLRRLVLSLRESCAAGESGLQFSISAKSRPELAEQALGDMFDGFITAYTLSRELEMSMQDLADFVTLKTINRIGTSVEVVEFLAPLLIRPISVLASAFERRFRLRSISNLIRGLQVDLAKAEKAFQELRRTPFDVTGLNLHNLLIPIGSETILDGMVWSDDTQWPPQRVGVYVQSHSVRLESGNYRVQSDELRDRECQLV